MRSSLVTELLHPLVLLARELLRHVHATDGLLATGNYLPIVSYRHFLTLDVLEDAHIVLLISQLLFSIDRKASFWLGADVVLLWRLDEWKVNLLHMVLRSDHNSGGSDAPLV